MANEQINSYHLQDIERYLNGQMAEREMHAIEKAALTDPFLADAIDGYRNAQPATSAAHLNEIAALIQKNHKDEVKVVPMTSRAPIRRRLMAAAAIVALLGSGAWLLMNQSHTNRGETMAKTEAPASIHSAPQAEAEKNLPVATPDAVPPNATENIHPTEKINAPKSVLADKPSETADAKQQQMPKTGAGIGKTAMEEEVADHYVTAEASHGQPSLAAANKASSAATPALPRSNKSIFAGRITNITGQPLAGASVTAGLQVTRSNAEGRFLIAMPATSDSISNVTISAEGYKTEEATLFAGRMAGIALQPTHSDLNEVVIVGYSAKKKKARQGGLNELKPEPMQTIDLPYPDGGWASFYDDLIQELGVNKAKANKLLHLKFFIAKDGKPTNFTVIKTPDLAMADKAIAAIKAGPRWKNHTKTQTAEVKMSVE